MPHWVLAVLAAAAVAIGVPLAAGAIAPPSASPGESTRWVDSSPPPTTRPKVIAYLIGDSITAGNGQGHRYGDRLQTVLNWSMTIDGVGATGFVAKGFDPNDGTPVEDRSFPTRLQKIIDAKPDIVIIAGGRNDVYSGRDGVPEAIANFYTTLRAGLPDAKIVTISPWLWDTTTDRPYTDGVKRVDALLAEASASVDGTYIDSRTAVTPFTDADLKTLLSDDGFHPNDDGYARMADELARALVKAGIPRGPEKWTETGFHTNEWYDPTDAVFTSAQ